LTARIQARILNSVSSTHSGREAVRSRVLTVIVALLVTTLVQCSDSSQPSQPKPEPTPQRSVSELTTQELGLLASTNEFGLDLFREIVRHTPNTDNVFISPLSVSYNLGLCYNGAKGETRDSIATTLNAAGLSVDELNQSFHDLTDILTQADPLVQFKTANSLWSRQGKAIQDAFTEAARTYYDARVEEIDFQAPWAADTINAWVSKATNGKITKMIEPPIEASVAAILMNAIYFKGNWMFPFDTANTKDDTFHLADGSQAACRMMFLGELDHAIQVTPDETAPDTNATFYANSYLHAVSLPYGRGDFRMTIIMPRPFWDHPSTLTIDDVIDSLTWDNWLTWVAGLRTSEFTVRLPRFKFGYEVTLNDALKALGMSIAFSPLEADFSNLFVDGVGWIDEVKQKSFIQVDEHGTEAAAVTQAVFVDAMPPEIICDRPFLIVIHEDISGAILFVGKIANPVWEE
jgi:serine protease inhibitor